MQSGFCDLASATILTETPDPSCKQLRDLDACCGHQLEDACPRRGRSPKAAQEPSRTLCRSAKQLQERQQGLLQLLPVCFGLQPHATAFSSAQQCQLPTSGVAQAADARPWHSPPRKCWLDEVEKSRQPSGVLTHRKYRHSTRGACNKVQDNAQIARSLPDACHCRTHMSERSGSPWVTARPNPVNS